MEQNNNNSYQELLSTYNSGSQKMEETPDVNKHVSWRLKNSLKWQSASVSIKELISKLDINGFTLSVSFLWFLIIAMSIYAYHTDLYGKIERLPTLKKNVSILKENISKQDQELKALESLTINDEELKKKESILLSHLQKEWDLTAVYQWYKIYQIAKEAGLEIESLQKVSIQPDDNKIKQFWDKMAELDIENIYDSSWYNKFIISASTDEDTIIKFKKNIEESVGFDFDGFTITKSQWLLKYDLSIKAFYSLSKK